MRISYWSSDVCSSDLEELARPVAAAMGASVCMSCYPMTGAEARRAAIPKTLSGAIGIGEAISRSDDPCAPIDRLVAALRVHDYYKDVEVIFRGKITGLERDTSKGWVFGNFTVSAMTGSEQAEIERASGRERGCTYV